MANQDPRKRRIEELEDELRKLGYFPVFGIDRDNVRDILEDPDMTDGRADEIARHAAEDLAENEMGVLPVSEAVRFAREG